MPLRDRELPEITGEDAKRFLAHKHANERKAAHRVALYLLYARIVDLEARQRYAPYEADKLQPLYKLIDDVLATGRGLTEEEIAYHKLAKYKEGE